MRGIVALAGAFVVLVGASGVLAIDYDKCIDAALEEYEKCMQRNERESSSCNQQLDRAKEICRENAD